VNAAEIATALGSARQSERDVKSKCPICGGPLALRDGDRGLMAKCWGGCETRDVYRELRRLKLISGKGPAPLPPEEIARLSADAARQTKRKIAVARYLWGTGRAIVDTPADHYLRVARGIDATSPYLDETTVLAALRYCPKARHSPGIHRPALLAKVEHIDLGHVATHVTYLAIDGSSKATLDPSRRTFGALKGGAVRLGNPKPDRWLIIGEGIETTLSVMQACALPGWAALSANGIFSLVLPPEARMVVIAADNDRSGVGQRTARRAAARFCGEGRRVRVFMPPTPDSDWNDVLLGKAPAHAA
jgi:hypothetical protein